MILTIISHDMGIPTLWYMQPAKAQAADQPSHTRRQIRAFAGCLDIMCQLSY